MAQFWPKFGPQRFFLRISSLLDVRNCCKLSLYTISRKTNEPNLTKWQKNPVSDPILAQKFFSWVSPILNIIHCWKLSLYAISKKTNAPNLRKWQKSSFGPDLTRFGSNLVPKFFSPWISPLLDVRNCCNLLLYAISWKTNEPILGPILAQIWTQKFFCGFYLYSMLVIVP